MGTGAWTDDETISADETEIAVVNIANQTDAISETSAAPVQSLILARKRKYVFRRIVISVGDRFISGEFGRACNCLLSFKPDRDRMDISNSQRHLAITGRREVSDKELSPFLVRYQALWLKL